MIPPAPKPPPPPTTLEEALNRLAYGDRGVIDRPAHLAFIREQIAAAVAKEREACAQIAERCSGGDQETPARVIIAERIRARGAR